MALPGDIPKTLAPTLTPVREWSKGDPITADRLTQHAQQTNKLIETVSPGRQIVRGRIQAGSALKQFKVRSGYRPDYMTCREWDGTIQGATDIHVAKPWLLRRTPFDGETRDGVTYAYSNDQRRVASKSGESNETQVVVMEYNLNDIIYAAYGIDGGTGVTDNDGKVVDWLDINADGRMWAKLA